MNELPVQSTFWRFLASLHLVVARQLLEVGRCMRQRVWEAAHVGLQEVTLDTDTTVQTVYGRQMGARPLPPGSRIPSQWKCPTGKPIPQNW